MEQTKVGRVLAALLVPIAMSGCGGTAAQRPAPQPPRQPAAALVQYPSTMKASTPAPHGGHRKLDYGGSLPVQDMNVLWDVLVSAHDHMSTISSSERNRFPSYGQTWYIPAGPVANTTLLYREVNSPGSDHADSPYANEGGYLDEGAGLGYAYDNYQPPGTAQMMRYYNVSVLDHVTPGIRQSLAAGYTQEVLPLWGYPRYNNSATISSSTTGNGVTASVNRVAGDSIWSWSWNGSNFINTADYGREMQSSIFYSNGAWRQNPTEAGDFKTGSLADMHGAPVTYESVGGGVISTQAIPLEWQPANAGASSDQLALYTGTAIGKNVNLNFMPGVASYQTVFTLPNALPDGPTTQGEIPTAYLNASYDTYWVFDAQSAVLTNVGNLVPVCNEQSFQLPGPVSPPFSGYGGVIISNAAQTLALGIYSRLDYVGGPTGYFTMYNYVDNGCPSATSKWAAVHMHGWPAGTSTYTTYVVTGTLNSVTQNMVTLYRSGY
jgi:hypothetical protein